MKKTLTILALIIFATTTVKAQQKQDTTIQITLTLDKYRELANLIQLAIDSKKETQKIFDIMDTGLKIIVADKPKQKQ